MINTRTIIAGLAPDIALPLPQSPHYNHPKGNPIDNGIVYGARFGGIAVLDMLKRLSILLSTKAPSTRRGVPGGGSV
jgi:hypothetical protein